MNSILRFSGLLSLISLHRPSSFGTNSGQYDALVLNHTLSGIFFDLPLPVQKADVLTHSPYLHFLHTASFAYMVAFSFRLSHDEYLLIPTSLLFQHSFLFQHDND